MRRRWTLAVALLIGAAGCGSEDKTNRSESATVDPVKAAAAETDSANAARAAREAEAKALPPGVQPPEAP
jgi:hypothetical protein